MKILVVDDVGFVRHYLDRLITSHGHTVLTSQNGAEALKVLKQDMTIQAVVTDLLMPGLDGIELFEESRKIDRFDDNGPLEPPKFILITALRPSATAPQKEMLKLQQAVDIGFHDVMLKPIDNEHLMKNLAAIEQKAPKPTAVSNEAGLGSGSPPTGQSSSDSPAPDVKLAAELVERIETLESKQQELEELIATLERKQTELDDATLESVAPDA